MIKIRKIIPSLILVCLITACGEVKENEPEPLYDLQNLEIDLAIKPQDSVLKQYMIPERRYEYKSKEIPHLEVKSDKGISIFGTIYDKSGTLSKEELATITKSKAFRCTDYNSEISNPSNTFELKIDPEKKVSVVISCSMERFSGEGKERKRTKESYLYPGKFHNNVVLLPENPLDEVIPLLNELGFSPYNNYDREGMISVHYLNNFNKKRDKFDLGFINQEQEGINFFWDEDGITNIVITVSEYAHDRPHEIDSEKDIELVSEIVSILTDVEKERLQKYLVCRFWSYKYEEGTEMYDLCSLNKYGNPSVVNLSDKFELSYDRPGPPLKNWIARISLK